MIPVGKLIAHFQRMNAEHWPYEWGASRTGCVDCSGAFVWAYKQEGKSIYHGSNRIARSFIVELLPISEARPGMAAFKARQPGEALYALPQGYLPGGGRYNGDLNDYHHIGLIDDDPAYVLNAKSVADGFKRSKITEGWDFVARLKDVQYDDVNNGDVVMTDAYVISSDGNPVKLRPTPSTDKPYLAKVPVGAAVEVVDNADGWSNVIWGDKRGYMMTKFLIFDEEKEPSEEEDHSDEEEVVLRLPRSAADALYTTLQKAGWG